MSNGTPFTTERIFSSDRVNAPPPPNNGLLGQCLTYGDTRALAVTGNYGIMRKKVQMRREILRAVTLMFIAEVRHSFYLSDVTIGVRGINICPVF